MRTAFIYLLFAGAALARSHYENDYEDHGRDRHAICADPSRWKGAKIELPHTKSKDDCLRDDHSVAYYTHKTGEKSIHKKIMHSAPSDDKVVCGQLVDYEMLARVFEAKNGVCDQMAKKIRHTKNRDKIDSIKRKAKHLVDMLRDDDKNWVFMGEKMEEMKFDAVGRAGRHTKLFQAKESDPHLFSRIHAFHEMMVQSKHDSLNLIRKVDRELKKAFPHTKTTLNKVYVNVMRLANKSAQKLRKDGKEDKEYRRKHKGDWHHDEED